METAEITYLGVPLIVHYKVDGKYFGATYLEPGELPSIIIEKIYVADSEENIYNMLLESQIDEIYTLLNDSLEI